MRRAMTTDGQDSGRDPGSARGIAAVTVGATAFSFAFIFVKVIGLPPATLGFYKAIIATGVLGLAALVLRAPLPKPLGPVFFAGVCFGLHQLIFITATQMTSVAIVTMIGALKPLLIAVISPWTVGERPAPRMKYLALLAVAGIGIVVWANYDDPSRSLEGDLLAVLNLGVFTGFFLFAKRARASGTHTLTLTVSQNLIAALVLGPAMLFVTPIVPEAPMQWWLLALFALGPGSGHLLVNWAHPRISAAFASLILNAVPILASFWAYLFLGEPYGVPHIIGMLAVLAAVELGRRAEIQNSRAQRDAQSS